MRPHMLSWLQICIRFLLLSESLSKRAHPPWQAAVTRREGGVSQAKSAAGVRQVNQEDTRHTWSMSDLAFRIKASGMSLFMRWDGVQHWCSTFWQAMSRLLLNPHYSVWPYCGRELWAVQLKNLLLRLINLEDFQRPGKITVSSSPFILKKSKEKCDKNMLYICKIIIFSSFASGFISCDPSGPLRFVLGPHALQISQL